MSRYSIVRISPHTDRVRKVASAATVKEANEIRRRLNESLGEPDSVPFDVFIVLDRNDCLPSTGYINGELPYIPSAVERGRGISVT